MTPRSFHVQLLANISHFHWGSFLKLENTLLNVAFISPCFYFFLSSFDVLLNSGNFIFGNYLPKLEFQTKSVFKTVFSGTCGKLFLSDAEQVFVYLYICVFVYLCICIFVSFSRLFSNKPVVNYSVRCRMCRFEENIQTSTTTNWWCFELFSCYYFRKFIDIIEMLNW